jgi:hypothetical protein
MLIFEIKTCPFFLNFILFTFNVKVTRSSVNIYHMQFRLFDVHTKPFPVWMPAYIQIIPKTLDFSDSLYISTIRRTMEYRLGKLDLFRQFLYFIYTVNKSPEQISWLAPWWPLPSCDCGTLYWPVFHPRVRAIEQQLKRWEPSNNN